MNKNPYSKLSEYQEEYERLSKELETADNALYSDGISFDRFAELAVKVSDSLSSMIDIRNKADDLALENFLTLSDDLKEVRPMTRAEFELALEIKNSEIEFQEREMADFEGLSQDALEKGLIGESGEYMRKAMDAHDKAYEIQGQVEKLQVAASSHKFPDDLAKQVKAWAPEEKEKGASVKTNTEVAIDR